MVAVFCTGGRRSAVFGTGGRCSAELCTGGRRSAVFYSALQRAPVHPRRYKERRYTASQLEGYLDMNSVLKSSQT